jgi:hypothetical protein
MVAAFAALVVVSLTVARAQDASAEAKGEDAAKRLKEFKDAAARYRIVSDADMSRSLVLKPDPVLNWSNPLRDTVGGAVFVWVSDGRPEVVASIYRYSESGEQVEDHEFQSLATTGVTADYGGDVV